MFYTILGIVAIAAIVTAHIALLRRWKTLATYEQIATVASAVALTMVFLSVCE